MRPIFSEVLLPCPPVATGGPEALHQLACAINRNGGNASLAYFTPEAPLTVDGDYFKAPAEASLTPEPFRQYQPNLLRETRLQSDGLIVYPETMLEVALAQRNAPYRRAVWWLSVDNATAKFPELADLDTRRKMLSDPRLLHFYQSDYAHRFLRQADVPNCLPLSDYTDPELIKRAVASAPPIMARENLIAFFPNKGAALAREFIAKGALRNTVDFAAIKNMTRRQVADLLLRTKLYIDFGHHPGKDRIPREAAIAGALVLLHAKGAASHAKDHPLDAAYLFTEDDIATGEIYRRIDAMLDDPLTHFYAQAAYRQAVLNEFETFDAEVRAGFFAAA